jgi:hypothetical protein
VEPSAGYTLGGEPPKPPYPVSLEFDGPEQVSRLSTAFRLILALPLLFFLAVIGWAGNGILFGLVIAHWLTLLVRGGRPVGWIGSAMVAMLRFYARAYAYLLLLTDEYPALEGNWFLQVEMQRPERLRRRQIFFWKTLAVIPHLFCLAILWFAVAVCEVIAWFAILFTGRFPTGLRNFVVGWLRWYLRVIAYWASLRDEFPPYSLSSEASAGGRASTAASAAAGMGAAVVVTTLVIVAAVALTEAETAHVSYAALIKGQPSEVIDAHNVETRLTAAIDDYSFPGDVLKPAEGARLVAFEGEIYNGTIAEFDISRTDFELREDDGDKSGPVFATVRGLAPPVEVRAGATATVFVIFEVDESDEPSALRYSPEPGLKDAKFIFD